MQPIHHEHEVVAYRSIDTGAVRGQPSSTGEFGSLNPNRDLTNDASSAALVSSNLSLRLDNSRLQSVLPNSQYQQRSFTDTENNGSHSATRNRSKWAPFSSNGTTLFSQSSHGTNRGSQSSSLQTTIKFAKVDRFVPIRNYSAPSSERYRTNRDPGRLSQIERGIRLGVGLRLRCRSLQQAVSTKYTSFIFHKFPDFGAESRVAKGFLQKNLPFLEPSSNLPYHRWLNSPILHLAASTGRASVEGWHLPLHPIMQSLSEKHQRPEHERIQDNIGFALNINLFRKVLEFNMASLYVAQTSALADCVTESLYQRTSGNLNQQEVVPYGSPGVVYYTKQSSNTARCLPMAPFKVLDAPNLRDDFYCSVLAYSLCCQTLAMGLGNVVYTWSDEEGVRSVNGSQQDNTWLTSISFAAGEGSKALFAAGRSDGTFVVMSLLESSPRFEIRQHRSISCLSWRPCCTLRLSSNPRNPNTLVCTEDLVVGDECGDLYYYLVEWPTLSDSTRYDWPGSISLVARISIHSQQICGLAWSPTGDLFASGGNDNICSLFNINEILAPQHLGLRQEGQNRYNIYPNDMIDISIQAQITPDDSQLYLDWGDGHGFANPDVTVSDEATTIPPATVRSLASGCQRQVWAHQAAVKAIAFCPWLEGLVATGGGSNDKRIHFFHTASGSSLATIPVAAQVTSLIWSNTKREIAATFGYAHPEHPYRIAVFSWPDCSQTAAIPWDDDLRALHAVPYSCFLNESKGADETGGRVSECIVVASSDETVKFHQVWSTEGSRAVTRPGMYGGSDILEDLQGIIKEGDVIR